MNIQSILITSCVGVAMCLTSGCASVTGTTIQSLSVQTREASGKETPGAACELTNNKGKWFVTTPGSVTVTRSNDDMQVLCNKQGYEPGRASIVSATKGAMFGNIILGGGIGAVIDHNSGAAYEYPSFVQVVMGIFTKIESSTQGPDQAAGTSASGQKAAEQNSSNTPLQPTAQGAAGTREERLKELKRLSDAGLISQEVFLERQRKILD